MKTMQDDLETDNPKLDAKDEKKDDTMIIYGKLIFVWSDKIHEFLILSFIVKFKM